LALKKLGYAREDNPGHFVDFINANDTIEGARG